jgi:hypothetical protein
MSVVCRWAGRRFDMLHIFTSVIIHALIYSGVREGLHAMGLHGFVAYLAPEW